MKFSIDGPAMLLSTQMAEDEGQHISVDHFRVVHANLTGGNRVTTGRQSPIVVRPFVKGDDITSHLI
jgi:hypothetical protein